MNKSQAIEIILSRYANRELLRKLTTWDENKTFLENASNVGISEHVARGFVAKYHLKFVQDPLKKFIHTRATSNKYLKEWDPNLTVKENAKKLRVPYMKAITIKNNYGLSYTKEYKNGLRLKQLAISRQKDLRDQCIELRKKGMKLCQIGRVYGLTRERIRQIIL